MRPRRDFAAESERAAPPAGGGAARGISRLASGPWLRLPGFAAVALLLCALGYRMAGSAEIAADGRWDTPFFVGFGPFTPRPQPGRPGRAAAAGASAERLPLIQGFRLSDPAARIALRGLPPRTRVQVAIAAGFTRGSGERRRRSASSSKRGSSLPVSWPCWASSLRSPCASNTSPPALALAAGPGLAPLMTSPRRSRAIAVWLLPLALQAGLAVALFAGWFDPINVIIPSGSLAALRYREMSDRPQNSSLTDD